MIPKYKTQLELRTDSGAPSLEQLQHVVGEWLSRTEVLPDEVLGKPGEHKLSQRSRLEVMHELVGDHEEWAVRYSRTDDKAPLTWIVDVGFALEPSGVNASIEMGVETAEQRAISIQRLIRPPSIAVRLASTFALPSGRSLLTAPWTVSDETEIAEFYSWLGSADRTLPLVTISVDPWSEKPLLNTADLQRLVFGLANVVVLTKHASHGLTRLFSQDLGGRSEAKLWTVFGGAVRIYWPGLDILDSTSTPFSHKLWIPERGTSRLDEQRVPEDIFGKLAWAAVHRAYPVWVNVDTIARRADQELLELRKGTLPPDEKDRYQQALARLERQLQQAQTQLVSALENLKAAESNSEHAWQCEREATARISELQAVVDRLSRSRPYAVRLWNEGMLADLCKASPHELLEVQEQVEQLGDDELWQNPGKRMESLGDGIREYRVDVGDHWYRLFVTLLPRIKTVVVLNAIQKKTNQIPKQEIDLARTRLGQCTSV